jgi:hypothetical protein
METKEFVTSFIDTLRNGEEERIYKYLTSRTIIYDVKNDKNMTLDEFVTFLKDNLVKEDIKIKRTFESKVCFKVELEAPKFNYDAFLFETKDRRFSRIELM